jgi:hypothetical protein
MTVLSIQQEHSTLSKLALYITWFFINDGASLLHMKCKNFWNLCNYEESLCDVTG